MKTIKIKENLECWDLKSLIQSAIKLGVPSVTFELNNGAGWKKPGWGSVSPKRGGGAASEKK